MKNNRFFIFWIALVLVATSVNAQSALFSRKKARATDVPPKVLLVQLSSERNRRAYLQKIRDEKRLALLEKDNKAVVQRTIKDFTDNFRFCPVYFFIDTNTKKIAAGQFEGVLLDSSLNPAQNILLHPGDTNFFIGCYGVPNATYPPDSVRLVSAEYYKAHETGSLSSQIWYVMDYKFRLLVSPLPYTSFLSVKNPGYKMKALPASYNYSSQYFDISYKASAWRYSATLSKYFLNK